MPPLTKHLNAPFDSPNFLAEPLPILFRYGIAVYANLVSAANKVNVFDAVLTTVYVYMSMEFALPAAGAEPPCHFGVIALPAI